MRSLIILVIVCYGKCGGLLVGRGMSDMTGLAAEGTMYGYADPDQDARGLHSRQYSRSFIFADEVTDTRIVLVVAEITLVSQALKLEVMERLQSEYGSLYTMENVMITATHSHSTPGGQNTYWMYAAPSGGYIEETVILYADGMFTSIQDAHNDLQEGKITYNSGEVEGAGINRSPYAYDQNPEEEKERYTSNVDTTMDLLKLLSSADEPLGMLNFFPVHTTTMKRDNHLISTDNKGYAAQRFESIYNQGAFPGQGVIVGAFAQSSEGDVTPNIDGDMCDVTFEPCSYNRSTCPEDPDDPGLCNSYGPTKDEFLDTQIIGETQLAKAMELYEDASVELVDVVLDYRHIFVNLSDIQFTDGRQQNTTCRPAMGYSFGAGATDGPGIPPFTQGELEYSPAVDRLVRRIYNYSDDLADCHYPKPILLPTGEIPEPIPWQPEINALQLLRIGTIFIVAVPAEFVTMASRRLTERVQEVLEENGAEVTKVILVALSNGFTSYVTTYEEYQVQRYEGASTSYGPNTLDAYLLKFSELALAIATGESLDPGPNPPDLRGQNRPALGNVTVDRTPDGLTYGDVIIDVDDIYMQGDTANAIFVAGNPRNKKDGSSFLEVQKQDGDTWEAQFVDSHWETRFYWDSSCHDIAFPDRQGCDEYQTSNATIHWDIPDDQEVGIYRLVYNGDALTEDGSVLGFTGTSGEFEVALAWM